MKRPPLKARTLEQLAELDRLDDELAALVEKFITATATAEDLERDDVVRSELDRLRPEWCGLQYAKERTKCRK